MEGSTWNFVFILMIPVLFYFMIIRPQQKEQREKAAMIKSLKPGDKILTNGGIIGVVTKVDDTTLKVRVAEKVEIHLFSTAVARVIKD